MDTTVIAGTQLQLSPVVTGDIASFSWSPANALTSTQTLSPFTIPIESTTNFKLMVTGANGCIASKESIIKVNVKLYMPDAFTPNGDGKNDVFRIPAGTSINLKAFSVYNRWGSEIFTTNDINKGWDGTNNGALAETEVYLFIIKARDYQGQNILLKGTVLLIR